MFVDDTGLLRRLDVTGDVRDGSPAEGEARFTVSMLFTDFGDDIVIEAPADAQVEIEAKKAAGYYALESPTRTDLEIVKGRALTDYDQR